MKKTCPSFNSKIDHLYSYEPEESKQKKEEQQRFACLDVSKLDDLVERAQAKTTKYVTKYSVNVSKGNFCIEKITFCFSKKNVR